MRWIGVALFFLLALAVSAALCASMFIEPWATAWQ